MHRTPTPMAKQKQNDIPDDYYHFDGVYIGPHVPRSVFCRRISTRGLRAKSFLERVISTESGLRAYEQREREYQNRPRKRK